MDGAGETPAHQAPTRGGLILATREALVTFDSEIQPVVGTQFGGGNGSGDIPMAAGLPAEAIAPPPKPKLDEVTLTPPRLATMRLLRSRVLEHTRRHLDLRHSRTFDVAFAGDSDQNAHAFVGRLLSTQNLMAAQRREAWSEANHSEGRS